MQCDLFIFLLCTFHFLCHPCWRCCCCLLWGIGFSFFVYLALALSLSLFGFWVFYERKNINDCETFAHCHICYLHCARHLLGNYCIFPFMLLVAQTNTQNADSALTCLPCMQTIVCALLLMIYGYVCTLIQVHKHKYVEFTMISFDLFLNAFEEQRHLQSMLMLLLFWVLTMN